MVNRYFSCLIIGILVFFLLFILLNNCLSFGIGTGALIENYWFVSVVNIASMLLIFFLPSFFTNRFALKKNGVKLFYFRAVDWVLLVLGLIILNLAIPILQLLNVALNRLLMSDMFSFMHSFLINNYNSYNSNIDAFIKVSSAFFIIMTIIQVAIIPAICEEMAFRGVIQNLFFLKYRKPYPAILITSFIFALIHFQFLAFVPRFGIGLVLGYVYCTTQNITYSVLIHFFNNLFVLFPILFYGGDVKSYAEANMEDMNQIYPIWIYFLCATLLILFISLYKKRLVHIKSIG